ncbi:ATP-grasp domain-containing protein [Fictibacillus barbaricus]|uniref:Glutathione synthase/RimK-type ligase-like ATP-grasp enzyme n=1 Tax=Fictibacillus barbaricus TaxID=182136 RepID=A0ABU1TVN5_9BACL|nr:alpha-L-glutamate ligase [Fictibacillus barbaricus]MDR7071275.1 glutathione synthase/RimK-type ligase-like ATP-grasp enzyme [Fictibacillus barbaricus]
MDKKIYVIHENSEWTAPLFQRFDELGLPYEDWHMAKGHIDLAAAPPEGIFYNRMSASSHTRGHRYSPEYTSAVLAWLESCGRKVFNDSRALQLEISKVNQYSALKNFDIPTPRTIAAYGKEELLKAADHFNGPFITKPNRAGKGLGVQLFQSKSALESYVNGDQFDDSIDGITLLQDYIEAPEPFIVRCEFVGGKFLYAVRVDTSEGFELCPADACQIGDQFCPITEEPAEQTPKFKILEDFTLPLQSHYEAFLKANGITFAGIEIITDKNGNVFTYDVNTNTNYNRDAEEAAGIYGMKAIAEFLGKELR